MNFPLGRIELVVSSHLAGCKFAATDGRRVYLSPAQWDLITHAWGEELGRLLAAIPLRRIPPPDLVPDLDGLSREPPPVKFTSEQFIGLCRSLAEGYQSRVTLSEWRA